MSSRGAGRSKNATNQAMEAAVREKTGRHNTNKKRKAVQGGPSGAGSVADDEWVGEEVTPQEERDSEEEEEAPLKRRTLRRTGGGIRIKERRIEAHAERRRGGGRAGVDDVANVEAAAASREGLVVGVVQPHRVPVPRGRCGGGSHAGDAARAEEVDGEGEDDEALVNKPLVVRRSIVLPCTTIPQQKIEDQTELNAAKERAFKVQTIALRVIHGWVFKSTTMQRGYHAAYGYELNHEATDIARAMWMGEDWRICVSPMVFHIKLDMDMKLPMWFVGTDIEDKHENDDSTANQAEKCTGVRQEKPEEFKEMYDRMGQPSSRDVPYNNEKVEAGCQIANPSCFSVPPKEFFPRGWWDELTCKYDWRKEQSWPSKLAQALIATLKPEILDAMKRLVGTGNFPNFFCMIGFSDIANLVRVWDQGKDAFVAVLLDTADGLERKKIDYERECVELPARTAKVEQTFLMIWGLNHSHLQGQAAETPTVGCTITSALALDDAEMAEMNAAITAGTASASHSPEKASSSQGWQYTAFAPLPSLHWVEHTGFRFRQAL
ncbi:hypothetical protein CBR_g39411 [Chara braunii]|uniref:Uncharacterized protein n=1 Tax=Chara braunii TaxID=69332 RepID=A0A388LRI0_CHABU|nr:hypothetical protein CBR_g39411 [Chara braunii]|eukprot:GBG84948.1 hypothetical protein CBR_g39411 [Chara braunii]